MYCRNHTESSKQNEESKRTKPDSNPEHQGRPQFSIVFKAATAIERFLLQGELTNNTCTVFVYVQCCDRW